VKTYCKYAYFYILHSTWGGASVIHVHHDILCEHVGKHRGIALRRACGQLVLLDQNLAGDALYQFMKWRYMHGGAYKQFWTYVHLWDYWATNTHNVVGTVSVQHDAAYYEFVQHICNDLYTHIHKFVQLIRDSEALAIHSVYIPACTYTCIAL